MAEYTGGTWEGVKSVEGDWVIQAKETGILICRQVRHYNADLISAAPDLYEACKLMDAFIENWLDVLLSNMTSEDLHQHHDVVKQAIAKAEGK